MPLALCVDEAEALVRPENGFTAGFFDALGALGQQGQLVWISAAAVSLAELFQREGLTSAFLSDARRIRIGPLRSAEVEAYLLPRIPDPSRRALAAELGGGFSPAVRWLGERLADPTVEVEAVEAAFVDWMRPLHERVWRELDDGERAMLRRCASQPVAGAALSEQERSAVRRLVEDGLLVEREEALVVASRVLREAVLRG